MVELGKNALDKIPLDQDLRDAIELAQKIKKEGRRRQLQLIGKMLRQRDVDPIRQALDKLKNRHNQQVALFHKLEQITFFIIFHKKQNVKTSCFLFTHAFKCVIICNIIC